MYISNFITLFNYVKLVILYNILYKYFKLMHQFTVGYLKILYNKIVYLLIMSIMVVKIQPRLIV